MQIEAVVTLKVLAEIESSLLELVAQSAYEHLFEILNSSTSSELGPIAAEVLMLLLAQQQNKDYMLQWAVLNGKLKEANWLIQSGADVNAVVFNKPSVILATEMRNAQMVALLLENGASKIQEALKTAQKHDNHLLTGLLLRHIGLEKKSGMLAWGNLNISELRSEYFTSSLIGKPDINRSILEDDCWEDQFERASESRIRRWSSIDGEPRDRGYSTCESDQEEHLDHTVKLIRPRSLTGAVLPFVSMDPRLEGPVSIGDRFARLDSPVLRNSYPGHPDGYLIPDEACGSLLPSPDRDVKPFSPATKVRAASALSILTRHHSSSKDDSSTQRRQKMGYRKLSQLGIQFKDIDTKPFISYADMSCNSLSNFNIILSPNIIVKTFLSGLVGLDLHNNRIRNFPSELCHELKNLKQLHLAANELEEFPYEVLASNTIQVLNLSKNNIAQLYKDRMRLTISLKSLEINGNKLTSFPSWIGDIFPALSLLQLSGNRITQLPPKGLDLRQLKLLDLSKNEIESVPGQFLEYCTSLTKLDLSHNSLISLPDQSAVTFNRLTNLKLSHNKLAERIPLFVPRFVLGLQNLSVLDISYNKIVEIPKPSMWASKCLRDLNFDHNRIRRWDLDESAPNWSCVCRLSISDNRLDILPSRVGLLTCLTYLNISCNPVKNIPDELGLLKTTLIEFPLDGLSLNLHPSIQNGTAREICTFLYSRMKKAVRYLRMKLMVVGREGRGKTTLLGALQGIKPQQSNFATVGIEVRRWNLAVPRKHSIRTQNKVASFVLSTWDPAGQEDFYSTHQCFLSSRALYLAVYDASRGPEDLESLRSWLLNIKAAAPGASVILVGTHADRVKTDDRKSYFKNLENSVHEFMANPGFPSCKGTAIVCCIRKNNEIDALKMQILNAVVKFTFKDQATLEPEVPKSYVELEDLLGEEANRLIKAKQTPIISRRQLVKITQDNSISLEKEELDQAVKFLGEAGNYRFLIFLVFVRLHS